MVGAYRYFATADGRAGLVFGALPSFRQGKCAQTPVLAQTSERARWKKPSQQGMAELLENLVPLL